jgi:hypothetical protein
MSVTGIAQGIRVPLRGEVFFSNKLSGEPSQKSMISDTQRRVVRDRFVFGIRNKATGSRSDGGFCNKRCQALFERTCPCTPKSAPFRSRIASAVSVLNTAPTTVPVGKIHLTACHSFGEISRRWVRASIFAGPFLALQCRSHCISTNGGFVRSQSAPVPIEFMVWRHSRWFTSGSRN